MPGYRTHSSVAAGCTLALLFISNTGQPLVGLFSIASGVKLIAGVLGGLFPDIDIKSKGQQLLYAIAVPLLISTLLAKQIVLSILLASLAIIAPLLPHRGITHRCLFLITAPLVGPGLVWVYAPACTSYAFSLYAYFVLGALTHIALDYWPRSKKKS